MHYAEGSAMPSLLLKLVFGRIDRSPMPFFVKPAAGAITSAVKSGFVQPQISRHLDYLEQEVGRDGWFAAPNFRLPISS